MIKRLCSAVAIAAVGGALVAGCGSSSSSSSSSSSTAAPASATSSQAGSTSTGSSGGSTGSSAVAAAVAQCKASIASASSLSSDAKTKLEGLCDEAAKGDPASLKKATAAVCQQIVKDTVPSSAQAAALAACPKP